MAGLELGQSLKELSKLWKACSLERNTALVEILDICHVELMDDEDQG
jgi:hypothetical protein